MSLDRQINDVAMEIVTDRFVLRDFVEKDSPAFAAYHADPRSLDLYGYEQAKPGHARELLELFKSWAEERPRRNYQLAIIQRKEPQLLSVTDCNQPEFGTTLSAFIHPLRTGFRNTETALTQLGLQSTALGPH